ncbi:hypothetical protein [Rhodococcus qingshengii]|uniref:hypothetical protein n=1 Tax=Rhodococcus qingshengii TaxID=334542 RepID=UPI0013151EDC|nr:hypothetical protein [Rhodococcus qingshengii]
MAPNPHTGLTERQTPMFHRKHPTSATNKENTMTETFNRYSIPGMGPRVDYGNGWLDFQFYPEQIAEKVEAFRTEDKAKLIELGGNQSGESFTRPAHPIEKQLLGHIGFRKLPRDLHTTVTAQPVERVMNSVSTFTIDVIYSWPVLENIGVREAPHLPPVDLKGHYLTAPQAAALVSKVHRDAAFEAMKALDKGNIDTARSWIDALVAHSEHPTVGA